MSKNIKRLTLQLYALPGQFRRGDYSEEWWIALFRRIREAGFLHVEVFAFQWEKKGIWNGYQPYEKIGKEYDVKSYNEDWWKPEIRLVKCAKAGGIALETVICSKYQAHVWENNINGITDMIRDRKSWPLQAQLARRLYNIRRNEYGDDRILFFRTSNEMAHNGDWGYGATLNQHHSFIVDRMVPDRVKILKHIVSNTSDSDFTAMTEPHYLVLITAGSGTAEILATAAELKALQAQGRVIKIIASWGKDEYDRKNIIELHNVNHETLLEPYEVGASRSLIWRMGSCGWRFWRLSTDGSDRGSIINPAVSWPFRDMSKAEIRTMKDILADAPGRIQFFIAELPKSVFFTNSKGIIEEDFALLDADLDRLSEWAT